MVTQRERTRSAGLLGVTRVAGRQWMAAFLGFLVAETGLVVRRDWVRPGLSVLVTGLITISLLLVKPPLWVDGLATVLVLAGVWWIYRQANRGEKPGTRKHTPEVAG